MPQKPSRKRRIIYFSLFAVFFLVCIPVLVLYSMGYTFDSGTFGLAGRGGIYVLVEEPNINIYIGNELKKTTGTFQREVLLKNLKPKDYLVIAGSDIFWPWAKSVTVTEGEVSALYPLLVPKILPVKEISKTDAEYVAAQKLFLPESKTVKISSGTSTEALGIANRKIKIWKDGNFIFATWLGGISAIPAYFCLQEKLQGRCEDTIVVFNSRSVLGRIDFYPDRDDAIILRIENAIYAMEIDNRAYHNFYPIYRGQDPDFRIDGGTVYIKDTNSLSSIELQS